MKFFTEYPDLLEIIKPAKKCIPQWFKNQLGTCPIDTSKLPQGNYNFSTIKKCPGIVDFLSTGYILHMWETVNLSITQDETRDSMCPIKDFNGNTGWPLLESENPHVSWDIHHVSQFLELPIRQTYNHAIKLINPIKARSSKGTKLLVLPLLYENADYKIMPGVIDTSFYPYLHLPTLLSKDITIEKGTPIAHFIPISDIDATVDLISNEDLEFLENWNNTNNKEKEYRKR